MKNLKSLFLMAAVIAMPMMFTSCNPTDEYTANPVITLRGDITVQGDGYRATVDVTLAEGRLNTVTAEVVYNEGRSTRNVEIPSANFTRTNDQDWGVRIDFPAVVGQHYVEALRVRAETRGGLNTTATFEIDRYTELVEAAFEFRRDGANPATGGIEKFGLTMDTGGTVGNFVIRLTSGTRLVNLVAADWAGITTVEALKARIDAATAAPDNRITFPMANAVNVNRVFGVVYNGEYFMLNVTNTTTGTGNVGTLNTVSGRYRH